MTLAEIFVLSIGLSMATAAMSYGSVRFFERALVDAALRERAWTLALYMPALPLLLVATLLLGPGPVITVPAVAEAVGTLSVDVVGTGTAPLIQRDHLVQGLLGLALLLTLMRGLGVARRAARLHRLIRGSQSADSTVARAVEERARPMGVAAPRVRLCASTPEALVAGFWRPVLILPKALAADPAPPDFCAMTDHELAHLKRGDHRALWLEEAMLTILAVNPLLRLIRDRRAAAREEACDALALTHADADQRRLYARSLLDALRAPSGQDLPALTFTNNRRNFVMHRLKAVLSPSPVAGLRPRLAVLGLGVAVAAVAGTGSIALAAKRAPMVVAGPPAAVEGARVPVVAETTEHAVLTPPITEPARPETVPRTEPVVTAAQEPSIITNPSWSRHPMPSYPAAALEQGLTRGTVSLSCTVAAGGKVSDCSILHEDPVGAGYGAAALAAAAEARLSPRTVEGAAIGGTVRFRVRFQTSAE